MNHFSIQKGRHLLCATVCLFLGMWASACQDGERGATVQPIATYNQLIGGPGALGDVGDFLL